MPFRTIDQSLFTHRKTLRLERLLGVDRYAVVGRLVALWSWRLDNAAGNGRLSNDVDAEVLAQVTGCSRSCNSSKQARTPEEWTR